MVTETTDFIFETEVLQFEIPVLVDFRRLLDCTSLIGFNSLTEYTYCI